MFGSAILDVVVGLVFIYVVFSLVCMATYEVHASARNLRAKDLERGIHNLLKDPSLTARFYEHPLIESLKVHKRYPDYIPSQFFALVLMDIVAPSDKGSRTAKEIRQTIDSLPSDITTVNLKQTLLILVDQAAGDLTQTHSNIENWFNKTMVGVAGAYKRRAQGMCMLIALMIAVVFNVDTISIANSIVRSYGLRDLITSQYQLPGNQTAASRSPSYPNSDGNTNVSFDGGQTSPSADSNVGSANRAIANANANAGPPYTSPTPIASNSAAQDDRPTASQEVELEIAIEKYRAFRELYYGSRFPLGWRGSFPTSPFDIISQLLGWLLTAIMISIGAAIWFDTLNKFVVIRATVKPYEQVSIPHPVQRVESIPNEAPPTSLPKDY